MSDLEPKKLKVAELREELKTRGLDTKGNKAQLVKRLEKSLAQESGDADVNDLDDSQDATADYDTSHDFTMDEEPEGQQAMPEMRAPPVHIEDDPEPETEDAEAEEPEDAQQMEDEPEEESSPEAQQEEAHQESAAAEEDLDQEEEMKEEQQKEVQQKEEQKETPKEEKEKEEKEEQEDKPAVEGEAAEAESEAPEADQTENDGEEGKQEENRGTKRRHDEDGSNEGRHQRQRDHHHRSRFDDKPLNIEMENDDWVQLTTVILDKYNSDLNLRIHETGVKANPITVEGFAFMWAGARATYGVTSGKVGFEVKLLEQLSVDHLPADETSRHVVRVGFSVESTSLQLGEEKLSYGYGGTGKASTECSFKDYGEKFAEGDVISAYVDFESEPVIISFSKNGEDLGTCFEIPVADLEGKALYPHILTKNTEFEVNFGEKEEPAFPLKEGFTWIATLPEDQRVRGAVPPAKKEECEMIMMCGLPGSGKTTWAAKYAKENPDKKFNVLGTNTIIDKMKVMGLPRKKNYAGRWDMLIDKATKCLNRMLEIAAKKKRNYILDQV